ncbi:MAG: hypothetical protein LBR66_08665 [Candidatus Symbiothrix sp.]|jgi:hypothetical protein|nr:hypothetical protein [Candidatus Symbiothrix sp.]
MKKVWIWILLPLCACACSSPQLPDKAVAQTDAIVISPDYQGLTIPCNIAPLNFNIDADADEYLTAIYGKTGDKLICSGKKVMWKLKQWKSLLADNQEDTLCVDIYLRRGDQWLKYPTLKNFVAPDAIDEYISYRLIEPSYVYYEDMTISQRHLTDFDEKVIFGNMYFSTVESGQCINCHSYQQYNRAGKMQFHIRQQLGGTVLVDGKQARKINLKTQQTGLNGVYPSWHPTENLIAYSINETGQNFHTRDLQKVEVMDTKSDVILYDVDKNEISFVAGDSAALETFPSWSADGKTLYYVSARYPQGITPEGLKTRFNEFYYDIFKKTFDLQTKTFSAADTIFAASNHHRSATFPRESPDGKYLLFTLGYFGNFHIWHKSADLYLMDLQTHAVRRMDELNSPDVESYHSWSSDGHWILFSSRRDDGSYTRLYIAYFKDGRAGKPFIVPQQDPDFYHRFFKSYNIPEFMVAPVQISRQALMKAIKQAPVNAVYHNPAEQARNLTDSIQENFYE